MAEALSWLEVNWLSLLIPVVVFAAALIALSWLRRRVFDRFGRWAAKTKWPADDLLVRALSGPSFIWAVFFSVYLALIVSIVPQEWKDLSTRSVWTLFLISVTITVMSMAVSLISHFGPRAKAPARTISVLKSTARVLLLTVMFLIGLDIWGVPTTPILLLIGVGVVVGLVAFRDSVPNIYAGIQISASEQIRPGDYIKLETGEEGYVADMNWRTTRIRTLDEKSILVPNSRLVRQTVINYGKPLKRAKSPFRFSTRTHLTELTGRKAHSLRELAAVLKEAPDAVVYYHTHHFLEEFHQVTPEPSNDFAVWVGGSLGDEVLAEQLAAIDVFGFPSVASLRARLVYILEESLARRDQQREVEPGRAFYFMKSVSVIMPGIYVAHDLREFAEVLRKVTPGSLYFHVFESRLRLGKSTNDFSIWLNEGLEEAELAEAVARLDPYAYTLEGLRSALIQLVEKRIK